VQIGQASLDLGMAIVAIDEASAGAAATSSSAALKIVAVRLHPPVRARADDRVHGEAMVRNERGQVADWVFWS
jgi:hypothetical protein